MDLQFGEQATANPAPPHLAYSRPELVRAFWTPSQFVDIVLGSPQRLAATISSPGAAIPLILLLLVASILCTTPYGFLVRSDKIWSIAALFFGSILLCLPSLHVFTVFFGVRVTILHSFILSSVISSVAGIFSLGFAPILWFLKATMNNGDLSALTISLALLLLSLGAGLIHLTRLLASSVALRPSKVYPFLLGTWTLLLLFVTYRMARALELLP